MPDWLFVAVLCGVLVGAAGGSVATFAVMRWAARKQHDAEQQRNEIKALRERLENLEQHGAGHRATVAVTETLTVSLLRALEDVKAQEAHLTNTLDRMEFVRAGGSPDAPWAEVYRWKAQRGK